MVHHGTDTSGLVAVARPAPSRSPPACVRWRRWSCANGAPPADLLDVVVNEISARVGI